MVGRPNSSSGRYRFQVLFQVIQYQLATIVIKVIAAKVLIIVLIGRQDLSGKGTRIAIKTIILGLDKIKITYGTHIDRTKSPWENLSIATRCQTPNIGIILA